MMLRRGHSAPARPEVRGRLRRAALAVVAAVAILTFGSADRALGQDPPAGASHRTALIVFASYRGNFVPPFGASEVRLAGSRLFAEALEESGHEIVTYPEILPTMREWRVRSERDLSFEFLRAVADEQSVEQVLVARLVTYRDRVLLLARGVDPATGHLIWADVAEEVGGDDLWDGPADGTGGLEETAGRGFRGLSERWKGRHRPPEGLGALVTLPLLPVGLGRGPGDLATHCLLRSLLAAGRWSIPDPALVVSGLQLDGFDPVLLESGSRRSLIDRFAADALLVPRMTAFSQTTGPSRQILAEDDAPLPAAVDLDTNAPVLLSLALVDCASGEVVSGESRYLKPSDPVGIFGIMRDVRIIERFQAGTDRLVRSLFEREGSS